FDSPQMISAIRIAWANPYATKYLVQYWSGEEAFDQPAGGYWITFPQGEILESKGGTQTLKLSLVTVKARFLRIWMTESSNTGDSHGSQDERNCVGYATNEVYAGNWTNNGEFVDFITHAPSQNQTATYVSSTDPWHQVSDLEPSRVQTGMDL